MLLLICIEYANINLLPQKKLKKKTKMQSPHTPRESQIIPNPGRLAGDQAIFDDNIDVASLIDSLAATQELRGNSIEVPQTGRFVEAVNSTAGVEVHQRMLGYIQAGHEVFSLVEAVDDKANQSGSNMFLARLDPQGKKRPVFYQSVVEEGTVIGRKTDGSLLDSVSKTHFMIKRTKEGTVSVQDLNSTNSTKFLAGNVLKTPENAPVAPVGKVVTKEGLVRGALRHIRKDKKSGQAEEVESQIIDKLSHFSNWSVKSNEVRAIFGQQKGSNGESVSSRRFPVAPTEEVEDPMSYEFELLDRFAAKYGEDGKTLLGEILNDVKRYAGFDIPKYKAIDFEPGDPMQDELGYLRLRGGGPFSAQFLNMPDDIPLEDFKAMSAEDQSVFQVGHEGRTVLGPIPERIIEMISEVYKLTGARVIRDDRSLGEPSGVVVYEGYYAGKPVFFRESYHIGQPGYLKGKDRFWFDLVSQSMADLEVKMPTESELKRFTRETGIKERRNVVHMVSNGELRRDNLEQVIDLFRQN